MVQTRTFVTVMQATLLLSAAGGIYEGRWSVVFVSVGTYVLTLLPQRFARWIGIVLPPSFILAIVFFTFGTLFLGEAFDFYERFWWWDGLLHFGSAMGFGLLGFLFIYMLFEGDRFAAPPIAVAGLSFAVAISIGALWEIFEFGMDQIFGLNMQKSGLVDTMWDLIIDSLGAFLGASAGFFHLKGQQFGGLGAAIDSFIERNRRLYRRVRRKDTS